MRITATTIAAACGALLVFAAPATPARAQQTTPPLPCVASAARAADGGPAATRAPRGPDFVAALGPCMAAMHGAMHAALATPAGDADAVFAAAMIPHHQGAVDMARQLLLYGRDPELRAFALGIIAEQQAEITMLERWAARRAARARPSDAAGPRPLRALRASGALRTSGAKRAATQAR